MRKNIKQQKNEYICTSIFSHKLEILFARYSVSSFLKIILQNLVFVEFQFDYTVILSEKAGNTEKEILLVIYIKNVLSQNCLIYLHNIELYVNK